jgi:hypothetical protein
MSETMNPMDTNLIPVDISVMDDMVDLIDEYFNIPNNTCYKLNRYSVIEIDEVNVDVYIYVNPFNNINGKKYGLKIYSQNVYYQNDNNKILESDEYDNIRDVLTLLIKINNEYVFMDYFLLSPYELKHAKVQRKMFPLSLNHSCSVCHESTLETTLCNHPICYKCRELCISKGKNTNCPICRSVCLDIYPEF